MNIHENAVPIIFDLLFDIKSSHNMCYQPNISHFWLNIQIPYTHFFKVTAHNWRHRRAYDWNYERNDRLPTVH